MSRDIERWIGRTTPTGKPRQARRPRRFARRLTVLSLLYWGSRLSTTFGGDGDVPELTKPTEMPVIVSTPTNPTPPATPATGPSNDRAVLALPGITAPTAPRPINNPPVGSPSPTETNGTPGGVQLDAPLEMNGSLAPLSPLPRVAPNLMLRPNRNQKPLVLDSPVDENPSSDETPKRVTPEPKRSNASPRVDPAPQRRGRLFGLFGGLAPASPAPSATNSASSSGTKTNAPGRSVVEVPLADPSAESALKRRIEKQARDAVGDRVRSVEVRLEGKSATVQASGVKLFQKRNVRRSLEGLPALSGLRANIEVLD